MQKELLKESKIVPVCVSVQSAAEEFELVNLPDLPDWTEKSRHSYQDDKISVL